ncbi:MAG TPA: carboxypeptidase-like regulatory domain-containing protein [Candidatus Limnocylindrales bacterium]|nr:carboxypeptidase-like regulatory domain-containing protein [Candidatus Limnocylindrales bacterium]
MRKILAITVALMIAAIVLMPALGYTNQAAGNQSYTAKSGEKVDYSFKTLNVPAHNLTPAMVVNKYSFKSAGVQSTRMPYSFQQGTATPYSLKLVGVEYAVAQGMKTKKPVARLGSMMDEAAPTTETIAPVVAEPVAVEPVVVEPVAVEPVAETTYSIEGMVVDNNQTGLAGWTINLTKDEAVINSVPTAADGKFAFPDLAAGEYTVSEVLMEGWNVVSPAEGMYVANITDASVIDQVFVNQRVPVVVAVPEVVVPITENLTAPPANNTTLINATEAINATV